MTQTTEPRTFWTYDTYLNPVELQKVWAYEITMDDEIAVFDRMGRVAEFAAVTKVSRTSLTYRSTSVEGDECNRRINWSRNPRVLVPIRAAQ